jgi:HAD superfamily hydrolase (TIGR01490 family)
LDLREKFIPSLIEPRMLPAARKLIQSQRKNNLLAIITATNRFLTEPIAAAFGIEHLIATEPEIRDGRFTGDIVGPPCMREGKIIWLEKWLNSRSSAMRDFPETWFYSDSINDLPLLERVTHPVAVDADPRLAAIARQRGWRSLSLR